MQYADSQRHDSGSDAYPTLVKLHRLVSGYMHFSGSWRALSGLTITQQLVVLEVLEEPLTNAQLCRRIGITSPSMTHLAVGLEAKGLIVRVQDPNDNRKVLLHASKRARNEVAIATELAAEQLELLMTRESDSLHGFLDGALELFRDLSPAY